MSSWLLSTSPEAGAVWSPDAADAEVSAGAAVVSALVSDGGLADVPPQPIMDVVIMAARPSAVSLFSFIMVPPWNFLPWGVVGLYITHLGVY